MAKSSKKRERQRVPKEKKRNLRLWAQGVRETILAPHLDDYGAALDKGWRQERKYWKQVCKEYHARIHWRTEDHEEPILTDWDPAAVVPKETLSLEDEELKNAHVKLLNKVSHSSHTL
jgi:hypothetical protein